MMHLTNWLILSVNWPGPPSASLSLFNWRLFRYYCFSGAEPSASFNRWVERGTCVFATYICSVYIYLRLSSPQAQLCLPFYSCFWYCIWTSLCDYIFPFLRYLKAEWAAVSRKNRGAAGRQEGPVSFISCATVHEPCWLHYYFYSSSHLPYYLLIYAHHYGGCSLCDE